MDNNQQDYLRDPIWQSISVFVNCVLVIAIPIIGVILIYKPKASIIMQILIYIVPLILIIGLTLWLVYFFRKRSAKKITCGILYDVLVVTTNLISDPLKQKLLIQYVHQSEGAKDIKSLHIVMLKLANMSAAPIKKEDYKDELDDKEGSISITIGSKILEADKYNGSHVNALTPTVTYDEQREKISLTPVLRGREWITLRVLVEEFDRNKFDVKGPENRLLKVSKVKYSEDADDKIYHINQIAMWVCFALSCALLLSAIFSILSTTVIFVAFFLTASFYLSLLAYNFYRRLEKYALVTAVKRRN